MSPKFRAAALRALRCGSVLSMLLLTSAGVASAAAGHSSSLWLLSVGVSRYADSDLNLNFADADARAVAEALTQQAGRRVYRDVHSRVLVNEEVTRDSILTGIREFIASAGEDDVAAIFLAGHGVRDLLTGTYYFLPHTATRKDFFTRGLRVEEFNDMVRILQRHVRHVVVILDTCHAGALSLSTKEMAAADDFASEVRSDGVFLLAATRPGDKSKEIPRLGHGVFTYALLGALRGEANAGADGVLSLAELVIYLGGEVPRLTQDAQTPYYLIAGTDLLFADVRKPNSIAVLGFRNQGPADPEHAWIGRTLQESFYFALGTVPVLNRCALPPSNAPEPTDPGRTAQSLGCSKFVSGSFTVDGDRLDLRARVVDTATEADVVTAAVHGKRSEFAQLQEKLVREIVTRMPEVKAYLLMLEAQGGDPENLPLLPTAPPTPVPGKQSRASPHLSTLMAWFLPARAEAQSADSSLDTAVNKLLSDYRTAHERKQIDDLAALWNGFSSRQREAMRRYFDQAGNLTLELSDIVIEPHEHEVTVALTRVERFVDRESGKPVRLQLSQRLILSRDGDSLKIVRIESR